MIIQTENLTKIYESTLGVNVLAVSNVSISINRSEFICIMGPSGSGKSTMLNLLGGLDYPTSGTIVVDGINYADLTEEQLTVFRGERIGFIFQFFNLMPTFDVKTNIALPLIIRGLKPKLYQGKVAKVIEQVGLKERMNHFPDELSGGEKQRAAIARALVVEPAVILADEPTGNLDSSNSKAILEILRASASKDGQTIIMVTHDKVASSYADRVIYFKDGKVKS